MSCEQGLVAQLALLTGQAPPLGHTEAKNVPCCWPLGFSQLNEVLLLLGYDRVLLPFFQFLAHGGVAGGDRAEIASEAELEIGVERFIKYAVLKWGNVKYAFKYCSRLSHEALLDELAVLEAIDEEEFTSRHEAVLELQQIPPEETYYLGYVIERELRDQLTADPDNRNALQEEERRKHTVSIGRHNQRCYLTSDHMDVYVATSMRERHEYLLVSETVQALKGHRRLKNMKLRWFDPTQAYCPERIDKGLSEALMLKRATCTLYLAQENDTLGKDSELASTLAQGKPVVVYVPNVDAEYLGKYVENLAKVYPDKSMPEILLQQIQVMSPGLAWRHDHPVRSWLANRDTMDCENAKAVLKQEMESRYDKRATILKETHPLGIQVSLETGVANGVLVVRTLDQCAEVLWRALTNNLKFSLKTRDVNGRKYLLLEEQVTCSTFRVVTGDEMLTNCFWNFYLKDKD